MNARTSRLLVRVAHLMWINDPHDPRQPQAQVLNQLKARWNATPPAERDATRRALVNLASQLIKGAPRA